jgi:8-oxo-dGDP phosphatase
LTWPHAQIGIRFADIENMSNISDTPANIPANTHQQQFKGYVWEVVQETFTFEGQEIDRDFIRHPGGVSVVAVNGKNEVLMIRQYRRPVDSYLWEIPAGLRDLAGEDPANTAKRELLEETSMEAAHWERLGAYYNTPGGSNELNQIFFARHLTEVPSEYLKTDEEVDLQPTWVPIAEAIEAIEAGNIKNPNAVIGILLAARKLGL